MFKVRFHLVIYRYQLILAAIILVLTGSIAVSSRSSEKAFPPVQRYPYKIALTFDDGPHPEFTERLVSILAKNNARATFFVVGSQVKKYPDLLKKIDFGGHQIANHSMTHPNLSKLNTYEIQEELGQVQGYIRQITGQNCRYFRPPGGQYNHKVIRAARDLGLSMVLWTVFPKDHLEKNPEVIIEKIMAQASDKGVIILHSGIEPTIKALPEIIKKLRNRGYDFVTISELYNSTSPDQLVWLK